MVSFTAATLCFLAAVGTLAAPALDKRGWHHQSQCMTFGEAQQVVDNYKHLLTDPADVQAANYMLTVDYTDYSESVNSLINTCPQGAAAHTLPLLSASFSSRKEFKTGQGQQQPINFIQKDIFNDCASVTVRWETTNTAPIPDVRPVVGIIVLRAEPAPANSRTPWLIKEVFSEFDSAAWLQNLEQAGNICAALNPSSPPVSYSGTPIATPPASTPAAPVVSTSAAPVVSSVVTSYVATTTAYTTTSTTESYAAVTTSSAAATASAYAS